MKFCPVIPEICRGQVHSARKERKITRIKRIRIIIIIIRNRAKTISLQTLFGRLNKHDMHQYRGGTGTYLQKFKLKVN